MIRGTGIDSTVKLYLKGNGANGSQIIFDDSQSHKSITVNGNAQISTAQSRFGGSSIFCATTSDYINFGNTTDFEFGTDNFDVSCWVYGVFSSIIVRPVVCKWVSIGNLRAINMYIYNSNVGLQTSVDGIEVDVSILSSSHLILDNTLTFVRFRRVGSAYNIYINGSSVASTTNANAIKAQPTIKLSTKYNNAAAIAFVGYMDELIIQTGGQVASIDPTKVPTRQRG